MGGEEDCEELSLELSIGGKYGKAEDLTEKKTSELCDQNAKCEEISKWDFPGFWDSQRRREIQAARRQEARRKREEKVKKSRGVKNAEDKLLLEAQKFEERVRDREIREKDCLLEEKSRKNEVADELGLSLFTEKKERAQDGCLYPKAQFVEANAFGLSDSDNSNGLKSLEQCSSAVSDYHNISQKVGSSSDTCSHSSPLPTSRQHHQIDGHDSSSQVANLASTSNPQPTRMGSSTAEVSNPDSSTEGTNASSTSEAMSKDASGKPPKATSYTGNAGRLAQMPCVSATGDGPNGRTVNGFLYRYDKTEVSIMCVCHGSSFSPAEFVKHAGGADVDHPLRHITVVPSVLTH